MRQAKLDVRAVENLNNGFSGGGNVHQGSRRKRYEYIEGHSFKLTSRKGYHGEMES